MQWYERTRKRRTNKMNKQGGLEKRKAEQGRLIFLLSTRKQIIASIITDIYSIAMTRYISFPATI